MIWIQFLATALVIVLAGVRLARYGTCWARKPIWAALRFAAWLLAHVDVDAGGSPPSGARIARNCNG